MSADRLPAADRTGLHRRIGELVAAVWLVYLADVLIASVTNPHRVAAVVGTLGVLGFAVLYVVTFARVRHWRRLGHEGAPPGRFLALGAGVALFLVTAVTTGEPALAMTVFLAVLVMFFLPLRLAIGAVAALVAVVVISGRVVPGWRREDDLAFQLMITAFAVWGVIQLVQRNAELARAQQQLAELAVSAERSRFARDLHDILGHSLTVLTVKAELAGRLVRIDPARSEQEIHEVERIARDALADVRLAVSGYRESSLVSELAAARAALDAAGIESELPGALDDVPGERRELFGWAVREGVTNVIRHSGARRCRVRVCHHEVRIEDDGHGLVSAGRGNGMDGLRERAEQVGARLSTGQSELGGFLLQVGW